MCRNDVKWQFAGFSVDIRDSPVYLLDVVVFLESDVLALNEQKKAPSAYLRGPVSHSHLALGRGLEETWSNLGS